MTDNKQGQGSTSTSASTSTSSSSSTSSLDVSSKGRRPVYVRVEGWVPVPRWIIVAFIVYALCATVLGGLNIIYSSGAMSKADLALEQQKNYVNQLQEQLNIMAIDVQNNKMHARIHDLLQAEIVAKAKLDKEKEDENESDNQEEN